MPRIITGGMFTPASLAAFNPLPAPPTLITLTCNACGATVDVKPSVAGLWDGCVYRDCAGYYRR